MKICTVNIPESYIDSIEKLVGEEGLYPSRSELIRVAVRDFLLRELKMAINMAKHKEAEIEGLEELNDEEFVKVPIEKLNEENEPTREFKTYKIIKRLEYSDSQEKPREDYGEFTWKREFNESYDPNPHIPEYNPPSLMELRNLYPDEVFFKFINEW